MSVKVKETRCAAGKLAVRKRSARIVAMSRHRNAQRQARPGDHCCPARMVSCGRNYERQIVQVHVPFRYGMGRRDDREGRLARRQNVREEIGNSEARTSRSQTVVRSVLSRGRWGVGTNPILVGTRVRAIDRALLRMQTAISGGRERSNRHRTHRVKLNGRTYPALTYRNADITSMWT